MTDSHEQSSELRSLLRSMEEGTISASDVDRIDDLAQANTALLRSYVEYMQLVSDLRFGPTNDRIDATLAKLFGTDLGVQSSSLPSVAQTSPVPFAFLGNTIHGAVGYFFSGWPVAYLIATVIFGIALLIGSLVPVSQPVQVARQSSVPSSMDAEPRTELVGRITGMVDCQWGENPKSQVRNSKEIRNQKSEIRNQKSLVSLGDKFALASGLMEITYDTGARVILQGPVTYEVESAAGGYLSLGKLTARLEKTEDRRPKTEDMSASSSSFIVHRSSFAVRTPTATVTDLGTEFGVEVDKQGDTTSHVYRGSVTLQVSSSDGKTEGTAKVLHENESARVENRGNQGGGNRIVMLGPSARPAAFVREIPKLPIKTFDLVDVVAGGDGFSGRRGRGIDPTNGRPTDTPCKERKDASPNVDYSIVGDEKYHRVKAMPLVDGVFIPNGRSGAVQVDSAGHTFADFGETDGRTGLNIWAGGAILVPSSSMPSWVASLLPSAPPSSTLLRTQLGGIDYAASGRGLIFLHANSGITFDLEAIRRANPSSKLLRFRATAGNTEPMSETGKEAVYADVWVLVDGNVRFRRREINGCSGAFPIVFPVAENDRFLTLAASDSGNGRGGDWILFGDPVLELATVTPDHAADLPPK